MIRGMMGQSSADGEGVLGSQWFWVRDDLQLVYQPQFA